MTVEYKLILTGDGETPAVSDAEIEFSSLNYSMNGQGTNSIDCVVEGNDYDAIIAARSNGNLEFYIDDVLFCSAALSKISINQTPNRYSVSLNGLSSDSTYTLSGSAIAIDSLITNYQLDDGEATFQTPYSSVYYVPGATIEYGGTEYTISDISFTISGGAPSWTLKEGTLGAGSETPEAGASACTFDLVSGMPQTKYLGDGYSCYVRSYGLTDGRFYFDGYYIASIGAGIVLYANYFNFELAAESDVEISITGAFTDLYQESTYDSDRGFETMLSYGDFEFWMSIRDYMLDSCGANSSINLSGLPAGLYTVRVLNIAPVADPPIEYAIELTATAA